MKKHEIEDTIAKLQEIIDEEQTISTIYRRAAIRISYWESELDFILNQEADEYIDRKLNEMVRKEKE